VGNGTLSAVTSSDGGIAWTATFTPSANTTAASNAITLANSGVTNATGNAGVGQTSSVNYGIDTQVPVVTTVTDATAASVTRDAITFTVTFDEAITGLVGVGNFSASNGTIASVTGIQNATLNAGDVVSVTVTMSEATLVTGTPTLTLLVGLSPVSATYVSGSGTTALVFNYTILAGQTDANGIGIGANSLALSGGTLKDAAGNAATITHALVATTQLIW
jgi:hypothetical protein